MYVEIDYYTKEFKGEPVADADFPSLCQRAGEIIEELTLYRLTEKGFPLMSEDMKKRVKDAICAQIEYLDVNGGQKWTWEMECLEQRLENFHILEHLRAMDLRSNLYFHRGQKEFSGQPG